MTTKRHRTATAATAAAVICAATLTLTACSSNSGGGTNTSSVPAPTQPTGGPNDPNWAKGLAAFNGYLGATPVDKKLPSSAAKYATQTMISNTNLAIADQWEHAQNGPIVKETGHSKVTAWKRGELTLDGPTPPAGNPWHMSLRACVLATGGQFNAKGQMIGGPPPGGVLESVSLVSGDKGATWKVSSATADSSGTASPGDPKCGSNATSSSSKSSAAPKPSKVHKK